MSYERAIRLMDAARDSALERLDYLANRIGGKAKLPAAGQTTDSTRRPIRSVNCLTNAVVQKRSPFMLQPVWPEYLLI